MAFEAKYQELTLNQIRSREVTAETTEGDVIVPDVQGDIGKVLLVKTSCAIESRETNGDRITWNGTVYAHILYQPAEGTGMEAIHTTLPFQHSFRLEREGMYVESDVEVGEVSYYLYHSRKLNLKVKICLRKEFSEDCTYQVLTGCESDCETEIKLQPVTYLADHVCSEQVLAIREHTELNGSLPDIHRILFYEGKIRDPQVKLMTNKAMIKGEIVLSFFYYSIEDTTEFAEYVIPFTEVVDAVGVTEEMEDNSTLLLSGLQMRAEEDSEGDCRLLFADAKIFVQIRGMLIEKTELVEDLFCTEIPLECEFDTLCCSELYPTITKELSFRENLSCGDQPAIAKIYLLDTNVWIESVSPFDGKTRVDGKCSIFVLYQSAEGEYCSLTRELPFSHELEGELSQGDIKIIKGHFSYHLLSSDEVEIRGIIYIEGTAIKTEKIPCILQAQEAENEECNERKPSLVIYFVQKGDTLWNIAKRYSVTLDSIIKANKLGEGTPAIGQKILIPR